MEKCQQEMMEHPVEIRLCPEIPVEKLRASGASAMAGFPEPEQKHGVGE
jgi:hypothetical protein